MRKFNALVTGASRGIGAAITKKMRNAGINVLTPSRKQLDLSSNESIDKYLRTTDLPIDILVNNAGINLIATGSEVSDQNIVDTIQVNLIAPIRLVRGIVPRMIQKRYGRIVNISTIWTLVSKPGRLTYSASKAGLNSITRTLAVELASCNILVNAVAPGYTNTELTKINNTKDQIEEIKKLIPLGRLAEPEEIAEIVYFLCSEANTYITGQVIFADGGFVCQ
ncbi:MAG: SDR family NAD(P)-dependent oxidoreductase [Deltaproteobacteria bacterium]|nr:SDR family NAD(P)-dependent oxidoreductase [Deltaproteobacteria bacterium]